MKILFFEWAEHENLLFERIKNTLDLADTHIDFTNGVFTAEAVNGHDSISIFVDSRISHEDLDLLKARGVKSILLRSAGFNMLDVAYAKQQGIQVFRVANYGPESIAEHAFALLLSVVRKIMVDRRKQEKLQNGRDVSQMGFTLRNKVIGLYGFGKIARETAKIAKHGFGMDVIFYDPFVDENCDEWRKVESLEQLFREARVVSIHTLLSDHTKNSVNADILKHAKGVILINTARGPIVNTEDALRALDEGKLSGIGADVAGDNDSYANLPVRDDIVFTQHTGFFTEEAVASIIRQTFENLHNPRIENVL